MVVGVTRQVVQPLEQRLARELMHVEPPKIVGGSEARRMWLACILAVQIGLHDGGLDDAAYVAALLEEEITPRSIDRAAFGLPPVSGTPGVERLGLSPKRPSEDDDPNYVL